MSELGHVYRLQGRLDVAQKWYRECVAENERARHPEGIAITKGYLAKTLHLSGQPDDVGVFLAELSTKACQLLLQSSQTGLRGLRRGRSPTRS